MQFAIGAAAIASFFILRIGFPLALVILLAWWLRRLDARWQAEAQRSSLAILDAELTPVPVDLGDEKPCWERRNCSSDRRDACPAYHNVAMMCWCAREAGEGALPAACVTCGLYMRVIAPAAIKAGLPPAASPHA